MKIPVFLVVFSLTILYSLGGGVDSDGDGLDDQAELLLGTDPFDFDSDCDALGDGAEVGDDLESPVDSDQDGWIDALESNILDADADGQFDFDDQDRVVQFNCGVFRPFAVANDLSESSRLEVHLLSEDPIQAVFASSSLAADDVFVDGQPVLGSDVQLFDDGSHGDRLAGDSIFSREGFTSNAVDPEGRRLSERDFDRLRVISDQGEVEIQVDDSSAFNVFRLGVISVVTPGPIAAVLEEPEQVAEGVQRVSHLVNLVDPQGLMEVKRFLDSRPNQLGPLGVRFFRHFADDYDTLFLFPGSPSLRASFGLSRTLQNFVDGIGRFHFDNSAQMGTAGHLKSVVSRNFQRNGPTLHEFAHRWGVRLDPSFGFGNPHWGWSGSGRGQLGGFDPDTLQSNPDDTFTVGGFGFSANGGDTPLYSFIELYLMGLAEAVEVPDIPVVDEPQILSCFPDDDCFMGTINFEAQAVRTVSIEDIIEVEGARQPAAADAPKDFSAAFVVVSQRPLNASEMAYFSIQAEIFGAEVGEGRINSFQEATRGRATMDTAIRLKPDLKRLEFPFQLDSSEEFTGYALLNPSAEPAHLEIFGYNQLGRLVDTPLRINRLTLQPGQQLARRGSELVGLEGSFTFGWLRVLSDNPEVIGFSQTGSLSLSRLDGASPSQGGAGKLLFQRLFEGDSVFEAAQALTTIYLVNPGPAATQVRLTYKRNQLEDLVSEMRIEPRDTAPSFFTNLFPGALATAADEGYLVAESLSDQPILGLARIDVADSQSRIILGADEGQPGPEQVLYSSQFASNQLLFTSLKLVNRSQSMRAFTLRAVDDNGGELGPPQEFSLEAGEQFTALAGQLFGLPLAALEGSLIVESDGPGLTGSVIFGDRVEQRFAAALPLQSRLLSQAVFGHVASLGDFFTGLAFVNPSPREAQVELEVFRSDGTLAGSAEFQLGPGQRRSRLLREWVPEAEGQAGGYIRFSSTEPLASQMLFGRTQQGRLEVLSAVVPSEITP